MPRDLRRCASAVGDSSLGAGREYCGAMSNLPPLRDVGAAKPAAEAETAGDEFDLDLPTRRSFGAA